jgi:5'-nucleotidase
MIEFDKSRRLFLKRGGLALAGMSLLPSGLWALPAAEVVQLTILHTNDTHSRLDPYPAAKGDRYSGMGGVARRKQLIDNIRSETEHVLLVDAGDIFQGTPYFNFFKGEPEMKAMQAMGYEVATMGNHDFDEGVENFAQQLQHVKFPFVVANYDFSNTVLANRIAPNILIKKGPLQIGIFGLGIDPDGLIPAKLFGKIRYLDPVIIAKNQVTSLRAQGADFILCLSHLGYQYNGSRISDRLLAAQVSGIDLIVGGHTHSFLEQPVGVQNPEGEETLIAQVGHSGIRLGRIDFRFEKSSKRRRSFRDQSTFVR